MARRIILSSGKAIHFGNRTAAFSAGVLQADTIAESAERAGKRVVSLEWAGGARTMTGIQGPMVDYRAFFGNRGLWTNWDVPGQPAGATAFGVQYQRFDLVDAAGWVNVPTSYSPAKEGTFDLAGTPAMSNDMYDFYVYDSTDDATVNYDYVMIAPECKCKGRQLSQSPILRRKIGRMSRSCWQIRRVRPQAFYVKAMLFAPDLSQFSIFFTSAARAIATCTGCGYVGDFEDDLNRLFPSSTAADLRGFRIRAGGCRHVRRARLVMEGRPL